MRTMQVASSGWHELKSAIAAGSAPAGVFLVHGPSEAIAVQAQALLKERSQRGDPASYFLSSASPAFQVPCFWPFPGNQPLPESLDIFRLFEASARLSLHDPMLAALRQLEATASNVQGTPALVLLEYLTPPTERDRAFALLLLKSLLPQQSSLVLLVHQQSTRNRLPRQYSHVVESLLCLLYMSGGRLRRADWDTLLAHYPARNLDDRLIASRQVGSQVWMCYANREVAERAEALFQSMEPGRRQELARDWLQLLPHDTGYPLLAIAAQTNDLAAMLSVYSPDAVHAACIEPEGMIRYYDRLQQLAHTAGKALVSSKAQLLSLAAQVLLKPTTAVEVYERLQGILPGNIDSKTASFFWLLLEQALIHSARPEDWEYASECSRLCLKSAESLSQDETSQLLAGIANGEALVAYKQRAGEQARDLEEFALAQLKRIGSTRRGHVEVNLGDVYLRLLGDVEAALPHYREALLTIDEVREQFKERFTSAFDHPSTQRAILALGNAYIQAKRYAEAIEILEHHLSYLQIDSALARVGEWHAKDVLKTRLALAQAYLKGGQERRAALCYWQIFLHPQWLEPAVLREVEAKLRDSQPALHERLRRRIDRIVCEQEAIIANAKKVEEVLIEMQSVQKI